MDFSKLKAARVAAASENTSVLANYVTLPKKGGSVKVRILPGRVTPEDFFQRTRIHYTNGKSFHCAATYDETSDKWRTAPPRGTRCPICELNSVFWKDVKAAKDGTQDKTNAELDVKNTRPVARFYYNCIVLEEKQEDGTVLKNVGPKVLSVGITVHQIIMDHLLGNDEEGIESDNDLIDLQKGRDFNIVVTMKGDFPDYAKSKFATKRTVAGTKEEIAKWMGSCHDLPALVQVKPLEELDREVDVYLGLATEDDPLQAKIRAAKAHGAAANAPTKVTMPSGKGKPFVSDDGSESLADEEFIEGLAAEVN